MVFSQKWVIMSGLGEIMPIMSSLKIYLLHLKEKLDNIVMLWLVLPVNSLKSVSVLISSVPDCACLFFVILSKTMRSRRKLISMN